MKKIILLTTMIALFSASAMAEKSNRYCTEIADMGELMMRYHQYGEVDEAGARALAKATIPISYLGKYPDSEDLILLLIEDIYRVDMLPQKVQKDALIKAISREVYLQCKTNW